MASGKSYVGDKGTIVNINVGEDITNATVTKIKVKKPNNAEVTWDAVVYNRKYIRYVTIEGDLNLEGTYYIQAYIEIGGWSGLGETADFKVYKPYTR